MKRIIYFLVATMVLTSCGSSKKMLEKGNYDAAIQRSVRELRKKPDDAKEAAVLDEAYRRINERDSERVRFLERENNPNNYEEIFSKGLLLFQRRQCEEHLPSRQRFSRRYWR